MSPTDVKRRLKEKGVNLEAKVYSGRQNVRYSNNIDGTQSIRTDVAFWENMTFLDAEKNPMKPDLKKAFFLFDNTEERDAFLAAGGMEDHAIDLKKGQEKAIKVIKETILQPARL
jgi:hypothetical protein